MALAWQLSRRWRTVAAFLLTPAFASLLMASLGPLYGGLPNWPERVFRTAVVYAAFYAYPVTLLLGVPSYLALRPAVHKSLVKCIVVGAGIAAGPLFLLGMGTGPDYGYSNGHVTHQNGMKTLAGWLDLASASLFIAGIGGLAGLFFWFMAAAGVAQGSQDPIASNPPSTAHPTSRFGTKRQKTLLLASFLLVLLPLIILEMWVAGRLGG